MKIKCDFCKTEYSVDRVSGRVECAVCGNTWVVRPPRRRNVFLLFMAALTALLAACVFAIAVVVRDNARDVALHPLVAGISQLTSVDVDGTPRLRVSGDVLNRSDQIYGVPWLIISMVDGDGHVISRRRFMPPATLLDAGASATFSYDVDVVAGVKKVTVELQGDGK